MKITKKDMLQEWNSYKLWGWFSATSDWI